jgi:dihydroorotase
MRSAFQLRWSHPSEMPAVSATALDLVIRGGTVVAEGAPFRADIGVRDGTIAAIGLPEDGELPEACEVIDASGKFVLPGAIDCHVHFREPGQVHKEEWLTGSCAAAFGGVTTVIDMPNTHPATDSVEHFLAKRDIALRASYVDFGLYGLISDRSFRNIEAMHRAGVVGFKTYLSNSASSHIGMIGDGTLLEAFETLAELGARCVVHAENGAVIENRTARLRAAGRKDPRAHADSRPDVCAIEAVARTLIFAEWTGAPIHIAHEGTAAAIDLVAAAKARGANVSVETCPQYLFLSVNDLVQGGGVMRCNPPLRDPANHARLWQALRSGDIDVIATDHAPHTPEEKHGETIWECQCGMLGVETAMPLMLTAVAEGRISLSQYVRAAAINPAKLWRLYPRKGTIQVGSDADIVIVDAGRESVIDQARLHSKSKVSSWHGRKVRGLPVCTMVRGRVIVRDGVLCGDPGYGRYVSQTPPAPSPRNAPRSWIEAPR